MKSITTRFLLPVVVLIVGTMVYSLLTGGRMAERYAPLVDAAMEIKLEAAIGHLWFEEVISGDRNEDVAVVWEHLDESAWCARAMLEGGENPEGVFIPLHDPVLRREIEEVLAKISKFRAMAEERWAARAQSGVGSAIDQRFDAVFEDLLAQADEVEAALQGAMARDLRRFRTVQGLLIALCLGLSAFIGIVLRRYERRQALDTVALGESEERCRAIAEDTPVLICRFLPSGEITCVNEAYCKYFAKTSEELVGSSFLSLIPEANREAVMANIAATTVDSPTQSHEHPVVAPGGEIRWQRWTNRGMFDAQGKAVAYQSIGEDVTERKRAEQELERLLHDMGERVKELRCLHGVADSIRKRSALEDVFQDVAALLPPGWRYPEITRGRIHFDGKDYVSEPFERTRWSQTSDIIVGGERRGFVEVCYLAQRPDLDEGPFLKEERNLIDSITHALSEAAERKQAEAAVAAHTVELEQRTIELEKSRRVAMGIMEDAEAAKATLQEVNARLEVQTARASEMAAQAEMASAAKSEFLANMSHEIRTPMTAILGFGNVVHEEIACCTQCPVHASCEKRTSTKEAIETIKRNGEYLLGLINDVLDLSKIEAGKMTVECIACRPCQIVAEVASLMRVRAEAKGIALKIEYVGSIPETIQSDPTRVRQTLINLIGNAIKFTEVGQVRLVSRFVDDGSGPVMQFDVVDTGLGMTEEQAARLFQSFTQADASTTRKFGGTGLGLAICKRLTEMLGGNITVVESEPGVGTRMRVTVATGPLEGVKMLTDPPAATVLAAETTAAPSADQPALSGCRVLLAEDGPDNRWLIAHFLKKAGAEVTIVENGKLAADAALAAYADGNPFDVILMDMQMPVMDGYEATGLLRRKGYTGPIIALTAHAMASDRQKCLDAGCDNYASKPINRKKLIETVRQYLGTPAVAESSA